MHNQISNVVEFFERYGLSKDLSRMSRISVEERWAVSPATRETILIDGCWELKRLANLSRLQYEFINNIEAFIEHAGRQIYLNSDKPNKLGKVEIVTMLANFLDGKPIYPESYHEANAKED